MHARLRRIGAVSAILASLAMPCLAASPQRIVSLNLCADQILVDLVAPSRIAALSYLAADPRVSPIAERARNLPLTRGEGEAVLGFDPDLVIAGTYSTPATIALLERLDRRVVKVPLASNIDGIPVLIRQIAAAVGEQDSGAELVAEFERRMRAAVEDTASPRPTALVYQVNGLASGGASLADSVMRAAGFDNLAARKSLGPGGQIALESLLVDPPDLLVLTGPVDEYRTAVAANLRHPALAALRQQRRSVVLPWRHWLCGTQHIATAVEGLAAERRRLGAKASPR